MRMEMPKPLPERGSRERERLMREGEDRARRAMMKSFLPAMRAALKRLPQEFLLEKSDTPSDIRSVGSSAVGPDDLHPYL